MHSESTRLLYVDDAEMDRELVRLALQEAPRHYELVEAENRADFVGKLAGQTFNLVITDLNILGFSGLEVLKMVKREKPELPVVILTGTGTEEMAVEAMKMGATDYVIKSVSHMRRLPHTIDTILENERLRRKLREAQAFQAHSQKMEALGRLAGGVAHDLNNVLTVMLGYGLSLREQLPENEDLSEILRAVDRASRMTGQLLTLSRRQLVRPRLLNLNSVVRDMGGMFRRLIPADIELVLDLTEPLPLVEVDLGQWEQVVLNLVMNAREAQPSGGRIRIATRADGEWVRFEISDRGPGLDAALRDKIFEPFFTTKGQQQGTGLGLATVYAIVAQSGGRVWVESPAREGSTFIVTFPTSSQREPHPEPKDREPPPHPRKQSRVLVVEDNDAIRRLVVTLLRREGYEVVEAGNGEQALQAPIRVELLVTDFAMPGMTGLELAEKLRPAKVLFTSGCSLSELEQRGFQAEKASFLPKPFSPIQLREKVHSLLD
jgi:two-component system cell cycle sensor histidine kinase/response regulator CckA